MMTYPTRHKPNMVWSGQFADIPEALGAVADATKHSSYRHYAMVPGHSVVHWFFYVPVSGIRKRLIRKAPQFARASIDYAEECIRAGMAVPVTPALSTDESNAALLEAGADDIASLNPDTPPDKAAPKFVPGVGMVTEKNKGGRPRKNQ